MSGVEPGYPELRPWQRPYTVFGQRYVPLLSAEGFREEGLASWYGEEEHGKPTSNGETYDMYKMTAAHKTLPLGSLVKVTSKANGRQTVVRVNDRGPFVAGRVIDLSYQAAREMGIVDLGVMPVAIEVIQDAPKTPVQSRVTVAGRIFALQVAAFSDRSQATTLMEKLKKESSYSDIQPVQTGKGFFYRVRAGRFQSKEEAEAAKASFARMGYPDAFIITLQ
jgi:rare lipoprotein A